LVRQARQTRRTEHPLLPKVEQFVILLPASQVSFLIVAGDVKLLAEAIKLAGRVSGGAFF
jgi:hypothetical protein